MDGNSKAHRKLLDSQKLQKENFLQKNHKYQVKLRKQKRQAKINLKRSLTQNFFTDPFYVHCNEEQKPKIKFSQLLSQLESSRFFSGSDYKNEDYEMIYRRLKNEVTQGREDFSVIMDKCILSENPMMRYLGSSQIDNLFQTHEFPFESLSLQNFIRSFTLLMLQERQPHVKQCLAHFLYSIASLQDTSILKTSFIEGNVTGMIIQELKRMAEKVEQHELALFELYVEILTQIAEVFDEQRDLFIQENVVERVIEVLEQKEEGEFDWEFYFKVLFFFNVLTCYDKTTRINQDYALCKNILPLALGIFIQGSQYEMDVDFGMEVLQTITQMLEYGENCLEDFFNEDMHEQFLKILILWFTEEIQLFHYYQISDLNRNKFDLKATLITQIFSLIDALSESVSLTQIFTLKDKFELFKFIDMANLTLISCEKNPSQEEQLVLLISALKNFISDHQEVVEFLLKDTAIIETIFHQLIMGKLDLSPRLALVLSEFCFNFVHSGNKWCFLRLIQCQYVEAIVKLLIIQRGQSLNGCHYLLLTLNELVDFFQNAELIDDQEEINEIESKVLLYQFKEQSLRDVLEEMRKQENALSSEVANAVFELFFEEDYDDEDYEFKMDDNFVI